MSPAPNATDGLRRGWCPGARRPMRTGDGLLVRLRLTGGILSAALARAVADCSRRFGNGAIDLSAKANLQLRGVSEATLEPLWQRLEALGVLDQDPAAEAVRNVVSSPLAGLDPTAVFDVRPVASALERRLAEDPGLHALPAKFTFLVDDGGLFGPADVSADVRFEAVQTADGPAFAVGLGGAQRDARLLGICAAADLPEVAATISLRFIGLRAGNGPEAPRRMRAMLGQVGLDAFGGVPGLAPAPEAALQPRPAPQPLGRLDLGGGAAAFGVGAPFGRWSADDLDMLADWSERFGLGELRLTPWRAIVIPASAPSPLQGRGAGVRAGAASAWSTQSSPAPAALSTPLSPRGERGFSRSLPSRQPASSPIQPTRASPWWRARACPTAPTGAA